MIAIILKASDEAKQRAREAGFREETVLIRNESCVSGDDNRRAVEAAVMRLRPYQFLVSDYWGMCNPD